MTPPILIWSLEGAVLDTHASIDPTIRRTVQNYFSHFLGIHGSGSLVDEEDVLAFRLAGGFDEPRVLTAALIRYLLSILPTVRAPSEQPRNADQAAAWLKSRSQRVRKLSFTDIRERADFAGVAEQVREAGGGPDGLARVLGQPWSHPLLMDQGEVGEGNLVRRLFQEIYLGQGTFQSVYPMRPRFYRGPGLIEHEALRLEQGQLHALQRRYHMGVVTFRRHETAQGVLEAFKIERVFRVLITREDVVAEEARQRRLGEGGSLTKPNPFMLLEALAFLDPAGSQAAAFIGSTPDDIRMARSVAEAGERALEAWGLLPAQDLSSEKRYKERLEESGADRIFATPAELSHYLLE